MKIRFFIFVIISGLFITVNFAQERTIEKKIIIDSKGNKDSTQAIIISHSEDITLRENVITINPLKFILFYNINYYRKIDSLIVIGGGIQSPTIKGISGFGFNAEARFHLSKKAPRGFYLAPNISYNKLKSDGARSSTNAFSIGVLVGWQWFPGDEFAMGLGIGIDHYFLSDSKNYYSNYDGSAPNIRFDIGYAW